MKTLLNPSIYVPLIALASFELFARAGGGSSGGGFGGHYVGPFWGIFGLIFCILFYIASLIFIKLRIHLRRKRVHSVLEKMSAIEPEWNEGNLLAIARDHFFNLQKLWSEQNIAELEKHLTPELYRNWKYQIEEQLYKGEANPITNLVIHDAFIVSVKNYLNDNNDLYIVCFDAQGDDQILRHGKVITTDRSASREFWIFRKQEGDWKLFGIVQAEGWRKLFDGNFVFERMEKKKLF